MTVPEVDHELTAGAGFRAAMARLPAGVSVVTTATEEGPAGLTVSAGFSVSLDPPTFGISVGRASRTLPALLSRGSWVINVLGGDAEDVATLFASREPDKFAGLDVAFTRTGLPWLPGSSVQGVVCDLDQTVDVGDHLILIGRVREVLSPPSPAPTSLAYAGHRFHAVAS